MRTNIVHIGATELRYEIRQIVEVARTVAKLSGREIQWENIGDPIEKGEILPDWMKKIIADAAMDDSTYGYSPTKGLEATREFLAEKVNARNGVQIDPDDILFFNGLGDAVSKIYGFLRREARVIGPSPAYSTHSSAEAAHSGYPPITYRLLPENNWMPDLDELRNKVRYNDAIAGIMIINPDNPTGAVFPKEVIEEMVSIAKEYKLFIVADEIYINMTYNGKECTHLSDVIGDVPAIALKGVSKEFPWPGGRCGWMEVYNHHVNPMFELYIQSILNAKMLEVCSTTLPQAVIPSIMGHEKYPQWQKERNAFFEKRSQTIGEILSNVKGVIVNPPDGAFYVSVVFDRLLNDEMNVYIENPEVRNHIAKLCPPGVEPDRKFVYQLLGAKNICVVPLSSFVTDLRGFRCTLLEKDDDKFEKTYLAVADALNEFLKN